MAAPERAAPSTIGRFSLRRVLGQGAQATVWLAHDPRLDREVALKLMHPGAQSADADDAATVTQWLHEARSVARLNHPHIVPVYEADVQGDQPYLVFEYVDGGTLAQTLRARGAPLPPRDAVGMMIGVLDALHVAHASGLVHRDLKPSNILVDAQGRARVMDFGIAARSDGACGGQRIVGTPGYMSPEAARGEAPSPAMDLYAVGLMLVEMLSGQRLIAERDPHRAIQRAANEDLALPATLPEAVDDALRALLLRAVARDAAQRTPSAAALRDALQAWLMPPPAAVAATSGPAGGGALDFLLRRMRHKSDFPALSDAVMRIQRVASSDKESLASLTAAILKDVALTNKLLRLVNTAHYAQAGGGSVSTVSRAVALVGFTGIRNMALSLVLLEHMQDRLHAGHLKEEFLRSLMAGTLAHQLCGSAGEAEEAFIGALFQNLGRMLTKFYFPEEARQVEQAMTESRPPLGEDAAAIQALGMSYEELGLGVARAWGLPESLQRCIRKPSGDPPSAPPQRAADRLRWLTLAANEVARTLLTHDAASAEGAVAAVAQRHARALGLSVKDMLAGVDQAREHLAQMASAMGLAFAPGAPARRLLDPPPGAARTETFADTLAPHALDLTLPLDAPALPVAADDAARLMAAGIQDITNAMVESFKLNEVLRMILETMWRALRLRRVIFCLRDAKTDVLSGRLGLGEGVDTAVAAFRVPLKNTGDLFAAVCHKGADTLIADAGAPNIAARLPPWYLQHIAAPGFLLLPLAIKGAPFALIYADKAEPGGIALDDRELALLRTLRNQAVMAFRQAG